MNQDQVKSVYVGGLTPAATQTELQKFFEDLNIGAVCPKASPAKSLLMTCPAYAAMCNSWESLQANILFFFAVVPLIHLWFMVSVG